MKPGNQPNQCNHTNRSWNLALLLLCGGLLSAGVLGGTLARYNSAASGASSARTAVWDVKVTDTELTETSVTAGLSSYSAGEYSAYGISSDSPDSHGYLGTGYRFTAEVGEENETAGSLSVQVKVKQNGTETWPAGMKAALYQVTGTEGSENLTFLSESDTGVFNDVEEITPKTAYKGNYLVCFKAGTEAPAGTFEVSVLASIDQID